MKIKHLRKRLLRRLAILGRLVPTALLTTSTLLSGCHMGDDRSFDDSLRYYQQISTQLEYPDAQVPQDVETHSVIDPHTLRDNELKPAWDLTLEEAIQIALQNSEVMRDLGGRVVTAPAITPSIYDAALAESDPLVGVEAALSAFDTQFNTGLNLVRTERTPNNIFSFGTGAGFKQTAANFSGEFVKTSAYGTRFGARAITLYSNNNVPNNRFPNAYEQLLETEFRHPLLQGAGIDFNRIAGPNARPGVYNGVLIARINTDVALADFELGVRTLVRDVEQTYWDLHFAYRDLDAARTARDAALDIWRYVQTRFSLGAVGADKAALALARGQYFTAQARLEDSLGGSPLAGTRGLYNLERELRRLMGLPSTDDRLIRPIDEPPQVEIQFDWRESLETSFYRRAELRRQQWQIKRRELELVAARNFRLARLDLVGLYRWRGFGDDLMGDGNVANQSAFQDLFEGNLQEWETGIQFSTPIGNRIGYTAIRNAELQLARERAIYREQERQVSYELAEAFSALDRAFVVARTNYNRREAAREEFETKRLVYEAGATPLDLVLDALQRATVADIAFHRSMADYSLALMQIHAARGTLLDVHGVQLAEGPWSTAAQQASVKENRRFGTYIGDECFEVPCQITAGTVPQGSGIPAPQEPLDIPPPEPLAPADAPNQ